MTKYLFGKFEPDSPLEVHCGDVEDDSFKPQDHEEPLREGAIPDALPITSRLKQTDKCPVRRP